MATNSEKPANAGLSTITSFRYYKGLCLVTLANGANGIIGNAEDMPLSVMLTLKGQAIAFEKAGTATDKSGKVHDKYYIGFAL